MPFGLGTIAKQNKKFDISNISWTTISTSFNAGVAGATYIAYNGSEYLAGLSNQGLVSRSTNLITWTTVINVNFDNKGTPTYTSIDYIVWTGNIWFAISSLYAQIRHSTNGINWVTSMNDTGGAWFGRTGSPMDKLGQHTVCLDTRSKEIVFLDFIFTNRNILKTTNGVSWTTITNVPAMNSISFANNMFYASNVRTGSSGAADENFGNTYLLQSTNAISWTTITKNNEFSFSGAIWYDGSNYYHYGYRTQPYISQDSITWTSFRSAVSVDNQYKSIYNNRNVQIMHSYNLGQRLISNNRGVTWSSVPATSAHYYIFNNYLYYSVGSSLVKSNKFLR